MTDGNHSGGVIVGGTDKGLVSVWDASKLIMRESDSQILSLDKHVGSVGALDFNKFQVRWNLMVLQYWCYIQCFILLKYHLFI